MYYQDRGGSCYGEGFCRSTRLFACVAPVGVFPHKHFWLKEVVQAVSTDRFISLVIWREMSCVLSVLFCESFAQGALNRRGHLALEQMRRRCTDVINYGNQKLVGIRRFPLLIVD